MTYNLAAIVKQKKPRAKSKVLRAVVTPATAEQQLRAIYMEILEGWKTQTKNIIMPAYQKALPQASTKDSLAIIDDWWEDIAAALGLSSELMTLLAGRVRPKVLVFTIWFRVVEVDRFSDIVKQQTGVDPMPYMDPAVPVGRQNVATEQNVQLVESLNTDIKTRISNVIWQGLANGTDEKEIARQLSLQFDIAERRARNIVSDQVAKYAADLEELLQNEASINKYVWKHTPQDHPRLWHVKRDGQVFSWNLPPWDGPPGTQPHCKCKARPYLILA